MSTIALVVMVEASLKIGSVAYIDLFREFDTSQNVYIEHPFALIPYPMGKIMISSIIFKLNPVETVILQNGGLKMSLCARLRP